MATDEWAEFLGSQGWESLPLSEIMPFYIKLHTVAQYFATVVADRINGYLNLSAISIPHVYPFIGLGEFCFSHASWKPETFDSWIFLEIYLQDLASGPEVFFDNWKKDYEAQQEKDYDWFEHFKRKGI